MSAASSSSSSLEYPETRRDESVKETLHGVEVADPYRWLEDPDAEETARWVTAQNEVTDAVLAQCTHRGKVLDRLKELQDYPKFGAPKKHNNRYYYWMNKGLQNQEVLYVQDSLDSEGVVFLDPNGFSADGTASIGVSRFSESGKKFAYAVHQSGSDWQVIHVKDTVTGETLDDKLEWVKFSSIAWTHDDKGFYYCRYQKPAAFTESDDPDFKRGTEVEVVKNQRVFYHVLGTPQSEDKLIYETPDQPDWMFGVEVSDDGRYFILTLSESCERVNRFYYVDLLHPLKPQENGSITPVKLIDNFEAEYSYVTNENNLFYLQTNKDAPRNKLIQIDIDDPQKAWREILPHEKHVLQWVHPVNNYFVVAYMEDVKELLYIYSMEGERLKNIELPTAGSVGEITGKKKDTEFFFTFTSFLHPSIIFHYDCQKDKLEVFREACIKGFDARQFETEQIFYKSVDGTMIPMFVVKKKDIPLDGSNPVLLYGYGGFNISMKPYFSVSRVVWMQNFNGIFVVANLRGGDEYGEDWHQQGIKHNKQNVFDDFKSAARTLIERNYTSSKRISIMGGSNGGLLVGACVNQDPDLYGCAIAQVGVLDMLRFHKFTIGYAWCSDYGCADQQKDFEFLYKYSPLHNVKKGKQYPAFMLTTADHDDRVVPAHSFKHLAELQHQLGREGYQSNPLIGRIETKAGHGGGKPMTKVLEEIADIYAFMAKHVGQDWTDTTKV